MDYLSNGKKFILSYSELKEKYHIFKEMTDQEFMEELPAAIHFACVVCFLKEVPSYVCLTDTGIIHELAHLLHIPKDNTTPLADIRRLFEDTLKLA